MVVTISTLGTLRLPTVSLLLVRRSVSSPLAGLAASGVSATRRNELGAMLAVEVFQLFWRSEQDVGARLERW